MDSSKRMKKLVKYDNQLNTVPFRRFNAREMNLFFAMVAQMRDVGTKEVKFSFDQIRDLTGYSQHGNKFFNDLKNTYKKMLQLSVWSEDDDSYSEWILFTLFKISKRDQTIVVKINPDLSPILNHIKEWTRFNLNQFIKLRSSYSKTAFRLLKQYRTLGSRTFSMKEFRTLFAIPKSYRTNAINARVLEPIMLELSGYFRGFNYRKIKRGQKIVGYKFTWSPELPKKQDFKYGGAPSNYFILNNINSNPNLSNDEKLKAKKKVLGSSTKKIKKAVEKSEKSNSNRHKEHSKGYRNPFAENTGDKIDISNDDLPF